MTVTRLLALFFLAASLTCCAPAQQKHATPVLFVGNSLTYVGNLPAVFDALAASNGKSVESDMIVKGGATLTMRVADGSVQRALAAKKYDFVVFQERGGDSMCAFGTKSCTESEASFRILASAASQHGAKPILLGTYQALPQASRALVQAEAEAAGSIAYVSISERLAAAMQAQPNANWFYTDGMHPGHDLVLLEAILLYRSVYNELPHSSGFTVSAPMYTPNARFAPPTPVSHMPPSIDVASTYTYSPSQVAAALSIAGSR
jgi:hypothetical protein